jgi:uncharacterized protein DUF3352
MSEQDLGGQPQDTGASPKPEPAVPAVPPAPLEPTPARAAQPSTEPSSSLAQASLEPTAASVTPTAPVQTIAPAKRPSRTRWAVAGLIALIVVALSGAGLYALVGASNNSAVASWAPSDSIAYFEVRGDLPGDQRQNLGRFLAHFPGFADQSTLETKLDETLDRLVDKASNGKHNWSKEIKPWFGGQVGVSMSTFPRMSSGASGPSAGPQFLLVASQKDPAAAIGWLKSLSTNTGSDQAYKGVTLTVYPDVNGTAIAAAATGGVLLVGDDASVKAAVDRNGKDGLADSKAFSSAMSSLSDDQVTRTYVDLKAYFGALHDMTSASGGTAMDQSLLDQLPSWFAAGGRFESDALTSEAVAPVVADAPKVADSESLLAKHVPSSTLALVEVHDTGKLLKYQLDLLRKGSMADAFKQIDQAAAVMGGLDKLVGWVDDLGVVVTSDGATPGGGLVIVPTDVDQATAIATQVRNLVALAGGSSGVVIRDEPYGSGTITTFDIGDASKLNSGSMMVPTLPFTGHVEISYTIQNGLVIVGAGPAWVKSIVDVKAGSSLADQARYREAMARVGATNASSFFVDITGIRKLVEPIIAKEGGSNYATDIKPYVEPFDVLASASRTSDGKTVARYIVTVIKPQ